MSTWLGYFQTHDLKVAINYTFRDNQVVNVRIPVLELSKVNIPPDWKIHNLRTRFHALSATIEQQLFP